ncbi:MAG: hypothetical protein EXR62_05795 [Chloroflexi bacterium]|nr:hypothetical protein [Chloroflexota bacterium]
MLRNTEALVAELTTAAGADQDHALAAIGVSPAQAQADLARLLALVRTRQPEQGADLYQIYHRYQIVPR